MLFVVEKKKPLVGMIGKELKKTSKGNPLSNSSITKSVNGLKPGNSHISSNTKGHRYVEEIHFLPLMGNIHLYAFLR